MMDTRNAWVVAERVVKLGGAVHRLGGSIRVASGVARNFVRGGGWGCSTNSVEDRQNGDLGGGSPLVRGSGGSCNLIKKCHFIQ